MHFTIEYLYILLSFSVKIETNFLIVVVSYYQVFPKSQKLTSAPAALARQDTIDETGEADSRGSKRSERGLLERQATERDRLLDASSGQHFERAYSMEREITRVVTSETYDNGLREQPSSLAQHDIIATVLDMKADSHIEMLQMSQRIGRLEDLLTELVKRLSHDSSSLSTPADEIGPSGSASVNVPAQTPTQPTTILVTTAPIVTSAPIPASLSSSCGSISGGASLGPILLRKRRSKSRKAPAPPRSSPEQTRLLEAETPTATTSTTVAASTSRKRDYL